MWTTFSRITIDDPVQRIDTRLYLSWGDVKRVDAVVTLSSDEDAVYVKSPCRSLGGTFRLVFGVYCAEKRVVNE